MRNTDVCRSNRGDIMINVETNQNRFNNGNYGYFYKNVVHTRK